ncbi:MAG: nucleotidyl transferase AbiEii/AbiGii toxin family protein, partial [Deltaproteobacteria bacterium]|nr:nucleotidyl transferase AbiEii/AbiGii toxin family protein [Deltaproteobacteria bacterium]
FQPVGVEINVSARHRRKLRGEVDSVAGDFAPAYTVVHLPQHELVEEKIFGALRERKKPRDFYDLYYMMRRGMLLPDQKKRLVAIKDEIITDARRINFRGELGAFLPANQQAIIRDFLRVLEAEIGRQTGS